MALNNSSNQMKLKWNQHERDSDEPESSSHVTADFVLSEDGIMFDSSDVSSVLNLELDAAPPDSFTGLPKLSDSFDDEMEPVVNEGGESTSINLTELEEEGSFLLNQALKRGNDLALPSEDAVLSGMSGLPEDEDSYDWQQQITPRRGIHTAAQAAALMDSDLSVVSATDSALLEFQELEAQILGDLHLSSSASTASEVENDRSTTEMLNGIRAEISTPSTHTNTEEIFREYSLDPEQLQNSYNELFNQATVSPNLLDNMNGLGEEFLLSPSIGLNENNVEVTTSVHNPVDFMRPDDDEEDDENEGELLVTIKEYRPRPEVQVDPIQIHDQMLQKIMQQEETAISNKKNPPASSSTFNGQPDRFVIPRPTSGLSSNNKPSIDSAGKSKWNGSNKPNDTFDVDNRPASRGRQAQLPPKSGQSTGLRPRQQTASKQTEPRNRPVTKRSNAPKSSTVLDLDVKKRSRSRDEVQDWLNTSAPFIPEEEAVENEEVNDTVSVPERQKESQKLPERSTSLSNSLKQTPSTNQIKNGRRNSAGGESTISQVTVSSVGGSMREQPVTQRPSSTDAENGDDLLHPLPSAKNMGFWNSSSRHQFRGAKNYGGNSGLLTQRTSGSSMDASSTISSLEDGADETSNLFQGTFAGASGDGFTSFRRRKQESRANLQQRLQHEISVRKEHQTYIRQLQAYYDSLLAKHALAELTIDQLRLGAHVNITTRRNSTLGGAANTSSSRPLFETRAQSVAALSSGKLDLGDEHRSVTPTGMHRRPGNSSGLNAATMTSLGLHIAQNNPLAQPASTDNELGKTISGNVVNSGFYHSLPSSPVPPNPNDGDTQRLQFLFRAATLQEQMELLANQAEQWVNDVEQAIELSPNNPSVQNHRKAPNRHEVWAQALRGEYDALQRDYNSMVQQTQKHDNRRPQSRQQDEEEELTQLEGDLFQLGMRLDEVENKVRDNLRAARRRTPFQFSDTSNTAPATPGEGVSPIRSILEPPTPSGLTAVVPPTVTGSSVNKNIPNSQVKPHQLLEAISPESNLLRRLTPNELDDLERNYLNTLRQYNEVKQRSTTPNHYQEMQRLMGNLRQMVQVAGDQSQVVNTPEELEEQFRLDEEMLDLNRELQEVEHQLQQQQQQQQQQYEFTPARDTTEAPISMESVDGGKVFRSRARQQQLQTPQHQNPLESTVGPRQASLAPYKTGSSQKSSEWSHLGIYGDDLNTNSEHILSHEEPGKDEETTTIVLPLRDSKDNMRKEATVFTAPAARSNATQQLQPSQSYLPLSDGSMGRTSTGDEFFDRDDSGKEGDYGGSSHKTPLDSLRSSIDTSRSERIRGLEEEVRRLREQLGETSSIGADDNLSGSNQRRSRSSRLQSITASSGMQGDYYDPAVSTPSATGAPQTRGTGTTVTRGDSSTLSRSTALPPVGDFEDDSEETEPDLTHKRQQSAQAGRQKRRPSLPMSRAGSRSSGLRGSESGQSMTRRGQQASSLKDSVSSKKSNRVSSATMRRSSHMEDDSTLNRSSTDTSPERPKNAPRRTSSKVSSYSVPTLNAPSRKSSSRKHSKTSSVGRGDRLPIAYDERRDRPSRSRHSNHSSRRSSLLNLQAPWMESDGGIRNLLMASPPTSDLIGNLLMHVDSSSSSSDLSSIQREPQSRQTPSHSRRSSFSKKSAYIPESGLAPRDEAMRRAQPRSRDRWCQTRPTEGKNRSVAVTEQQPFTEDIPFNEEDAEAWDYWNSGKFFPSRGPLPASILRKRPPSQTNGSQQRNPPAFNGGKFTPPRREGPVPVSDMKTNRSVTSSAPDYDGPFTPSTGMSMPYFSSPAPTMREYTTGFPNPMRYYVREYSTQPQMPPSNWMRTYSNVSSPSLSRQRYHSKLKGSDLHLSDEDSDDSWKDRRRHSRKKTPEEDEFLKYSVAGALRTAQTMKRLTKKMKCDLQSSLQPFSNATSQWSIPYSGSHRHLDLNLGLAN